LNAERHAARDRLPVDDYFRAARWRWIFLSSATTSMRQLGSASGASYS
jgi:hypothetical protein